MLLKNRSLTFPCNQVPSAVVLGFYLFYTLLYGFSILFIFEGLGIKATRAKEKRES
jgi:hypothetical protein